MPATVSQVSKALTQTGVEPWSKGAGQWPLGPTSGKHARVRNTMSSIGMTVSPCLNCNRSEPEGQNWSPPERRKSL